MNMTTIKIDNIDYDLDTLSDEAKAQLASLQFCDQELARLQAQAAALQTARMAYAKALNEALTPPMGDKLSFN
jgi:DNA repair ATPase RecN